MIRNTELKPRILGHASGSAGIPGNDYAPAASGPGFSRVLGLDMTVVAQGKLPQIITIIIIINFFNNYYYYYDYYYVYI